MTLNSSADTFISQVRRNSVALISLFVALSSLGYNTWRNEQTEANRNVRAAGFAVIEHIAHLQRVIFEIRWGEGVRSNAAEEGWVDVLTLQDLAHAMPAEVAERAGALLESWRRNARAIAEPERYDAVDSALDELRQSTLEALRELD